MGSIVNFSIFHLNYSKYSKIKNFTSLKDKSHVSNVNHILLDFVVYISQRQKKKEILKMAEFNITGSNVINCFNNWHLILYVLDNFSHYKFQKKKIKNRMSWLKKGILFYVRKFYKFLLVSSSIINDKKEMFKVKKIKINFLSKRKKRRARRGKLFNNLIKSSKIIINHKGKYSYNLKRNFVVKTRNIINLMKKNTWSHVKIKKSIIIVSRKIFYYLNLFFFRMPFLLNLKQKLIEFFLFYFFEYRFNKIFIPKLLFFINSEMTPVASFISFFIGLKIVSRYRLGTIIWKCNNYLKRFWKKRFITGFKILVAGRISRKDRASYRWRKEGAASSNSNFAAIDISNRLLAMRYGVSTIKVWIQK